ncbi:hypothetical protein SAMN05421759_12335 [Roseivivax lentus]|uniref:Uncharacterized protein n=1 Tax=Roseivivax lentus TaxID=633194 RepID=A0A1N7PZM5_9RHOB|nr:hypothetical protein [Roseivivax lentus]SIT16041.1 hypothetical protein SAMN05421759_12335 [Roseivivax lentus]
MRHAALAGTVLLIGTVSAMGAAALIEDDPRDMIEIVVSADKLAECRETLAQVAAMPARHDNGTPLLLDWGQSDLPKVACVVGEA